MFHMEKLIWEQLEHGHSGDIYRCKVPNGWLVKEYMNVCHYTADGQLKEGNDWRIAICFMPDPNHEWLKQPEKKTREGCAEFERKEHKDQTGDCQTDGHFMCGLCKHIAPFEMMDLSDNRMRYYREREEEERHSQMLDNELQSRWNEEKIIESEA